MEKPYLGRAVINDHSDTLEIIIPSKKKWFETIFTCFWLCGWLFGEVIGLGLLTGLFSSGFFGLFIVAWTSFWTFAGLVAVRAVIWGFAGKEIIRLGNGQLSISRKNDIFFRSKTYDLSNVKELRVQDDEPAYSLWGGTRNSILGQPRGGNIRFDYGMQTVKFAIAVDEPEAQYIIDEIKIKHFI